MHDDLIPNDAGVDVPTSTISAALTYLQRFQLPVCMLDYT